MDRTYWHRQTSDKPLFPDLAWSRPENKLYAGKLLIIGGNKYGFAAAAEAFAEAEKAGIGTIRVLLPDSLQKTVGKVFAAGEYVASTPSGSIARNALDEVLVASDWADAVLLAGDFGRNSETAILLESFLGHYENQMTVTKDAADYFTTAPLPLLNRPETSLIISFAQLQKIGVNAHWKTPFTFNMDLLRLVENLHELTETYPACAIITKHLNTIFVATKGQVSTTKLTADQPIWRTQTAARAVVWRLQNPGKPFEALTAAIAAAT